MTSMLTGWQSYTSYMSYMVAKGTRLGTMDKPVWQVRLAGQPCNRTGV